MERWKAEKEARLAGEEAGDKEEVEEEEYIYAVQEDEVMHSMQYTTTVKPA